MTHPSALRIVFAGTPAFAAVALQALLDSPHQILAVYTQPDRPAGRGQQLTASPVKTLARSANVPVMQPATLKDPAVQAEFAALKPDVLVVAAYGLIIPDAILKMPSHGGINIHPSLLPRWRGAAPIQRTLFAGDRQTGVTIMQMDAGLDTGPIMLQTHYDISPSETTATLHDVLALQGAKALIEVLNAEAVSPLPRLAQDNTAATYADKISKAEAQLNWQLSAETLNHHIRAFNPWPVAFTHCHGETVRVWQAMPLSEKTTLAPGTLLHASAEGIDVAAGEGSVLRLLSLQWPGGKALSVRDFYHTKQQQFTQGLLFT